MYSLEVPHSYDDHKLPHILEEETQYWWLRILSRRVLWVKHHARIHSVAVTTTVHDSNLSARNHSAHQRVKQGQFAANVCFEHSPGRNG